MKQVGTLVLGVCIAANVLYAAEELPPAPDWSGNVQLGYTGVGGNTQSTNLTNKLNAIYQKNKWTDTFTVESLYSSSNSVASAEHYAATAEFNFNFEPISFLFMRNNSIYDKFNAYDINISNVIGYGKRVFDNQKVSIDLQAGPGERVTRINNTLNYADEYITFLGEALNWQISSNATIQQSLNTEIGENNTFTQLQTAITTNIIGNLGSQISFSVTNNSTIPPGSTNTQNTDYRTEVDLLLNF
jgi:putative salt-induced outer membrane protein